MQGTMRRCSVVVVAAVVALGGLTGCGKGSDSATEADKAAVTTLAKADAGAPATTAAGASATTTTGVSQRQWVSVGKVGWYDGFKITLVDLEALPSDYGTKVTVNVTYENLGSDPGNARDGQFVYLGKVLTAFWDTPQLPGGGKSGGTIKANVDTGKAPLDKAVFDKMLSNLTIQWGQADDNQTVMPLDPTQAVTSSEPKTLALTEIGRAHV